MLNTAFRAPYELRLRLGHSLQWRHVLISGTAHELADLRRLVARWGVLNERIAVERLASAVFSDARLLALLDALTIMTERRGVRINVVPLGLLVSLTRTALSHDADAWTDLRTRLRDTSFAISACPELVELS